MFKKVHAMSQSRMCVCGKPQLPIGSYTRIERVRFVSLSLNLNTTYRFYMKIEIYYLIIVILLVCVFYFLSFPHKIQHSDIFLLRNINV